ncbi:RteC domain-containing protein [Pedobacter xixiisoli]|nr:RteC domain-containing protein [Pedobacter xixiisoli]
MMLDAIRDGLKGLEGELGRIAFEDFGPFEKFVQTIAAAESALKHLRKLVGANQFDNAADEILFFKKIKPQFECWKLYAVERYRIETWCVGGDYQTSFDYFFNEIRRIERFFCNYGFYYRYYRQDDSALDELLFLRECFTNDRRLIASTEASHRDFCTNGDHLFTRFIASEKMVSFLQQQIFALDGLVPINR